jgi:hypothetical protein
MLDLTAPFRSETSSSDDTSEHNLREPTKPSARYHLIPAPFSSASFHRRPGGASAVATPFVRASADERHGDGCASGSTTVVTRPNWSDFSVSSSIFSQIRFIVSKRSIIARNPGCLFVEHFSLVLTSIEFLIRAPLMLTCAHKSSSGSLHARVPITGYADKTVIQRSNYEDFLSSLVFDASPPLAAAASSCARLLKMKAPLSRSSGFAHDAAAWNLLYDCQALGS